MYINLDIKSCGVVVKIKCSDRLADILKKEKFFYEYIPSFAYVKNRSATKNIICIEDSKVFEFKQLYGHFTIKGMLNRHFSIKDLVTLIEYCLEYFRQNENIYCIHGSSASYKDKVVIAIGGASGIGKTTVINNLVQHYDFDLVGDDKVLINSKLKTVGGIPKFIKNKKNLLTDVNNNFSIANYEKDIVCIFQPVINKEGAFYIDRWSKEKINFHLYEEMSRKIRGISRRIHEYSLPIDSIDTRSLAIKRSKLSLKYSEFIHAFTIYGDKNRVSEFLVEFLSKY